MQDVQRVLAPRAAVAPLPRRIGRADVEMLVMHVTNVGEAVRALMANFGER